MVIHPRAYHMWYTVWRYTRVHILCDTLYGDTPACISYVIHCMAIQLRAYHMWYTVWWYTRTHFVCDTLYGDTQVVIYVYQRRNIFCRTKNFQQWMSRLYTRDRGMHTVMHIRSKPATGYLKYYSSYISLACTRYIMTLIILMDQTMNSISWHHTCMQNIPCYLL